MLNFDAMNETDVREIVVRPLLHRLGYCHGTEANIRTEVKLRYPHAFVGRKKAGKDPDLSGKADYICDVVSYGRWVVEVKGPNEPINRDCIEQAHTYAAHPEIGSFFFLVTNGRKFQLYRTGNLGNPVLDWNYEDLEHNYLRLLNLVGPNAIKKLVDVTRADPACPLGPDVPSNITITGGLIVFEEQWSDTPLVPREMIEGLQLPVTGGFVTRAEDGRIHAHVKTAKASAILGPLNEFGIANEEYDFFSSDEFISIDRGAPSIFQNLYKKSIPTGTIVKGPFGNVSMPYGFTLQAFTEAIGFIESHVFRGTMRIDYNLALEGLTEPVRQAIEQRYGPIPNHSDFSGVGRFEVQFA